MTTELHEGLPVPEPGEPNSLHELVAEIEVARGNFFEAVDKYTSFPTQRNAKGIETTADSHETAFLKSAEFILNDEENPVPERSTLIASMLKTEDRKRVDHFSFLCGDGATFSEDSECKEDISAALIEALQESTKQQVLEIVAVGYRAGLELDLNKLVEYAEKTRNGKVLETAWSIGKTAFDVAKIAAGVAIGMRLVRPRK